jgi:hypothetical protein
MRLVAMMSILCLGLISHGQNEQLSVSAEYTPGFLIAHRADLKGLATHNYGFAIGLEREMHNSFWGKNYRKPVVGGNVVVYNIGRENTGYAVGGLLTCKLQIIQLGRSTLHFRMGTGLSYLTKKFDIFTNRRNVAIGTHINGSMQTALLGHTNFNPLFLEYGLVMTHYSNAAFKLPNLGYNMPAFLFKVGYGLGDAKTLKYDSFHRNNWQYSGTLLYGRRQADYSNPVNFNIQAMQLRVLKKGKANNQWRIGIDAALDKTYRFAKDITIDLSEIPLNQQLEVAVSTGYQWNFGRMDVLGEIGAYVLQPEKLKKPLLQRAGLRYRITEEIALQSTLKFHRGVADYLELGISYTR